MRIAIVTSSEHSYASLLLESAHTIPNAEFVVILNQPKQRSRKKMLKKIFRVGLLGAYLGFLSRRWYRNKFKSIREICTEKRYPLFELINFRVLPRDREILSTFDLGISMGNGYIPNRFFEMFKHGMINIHHEILPNYPGAQSVVWPLILNQTETGFSIHFISSKIDQGDIILSSRRAITFNASLSATVKDNYRDSLSLSVSTLIELLGRPIAEWKREKQPHRRSYTTPTFYQWLMGYLNFNRRRREFNS